MSVLACHIRNEDAPMSEYVNSIHTYCYLYIMLSLPSCYFVLNNLYQICLMSILTRVVVLNKGFCKNFTKFQCKAFFFILC